MIKLENYEVVGWEHAIRGMRNPMNSWENSDSDYRETLCSTCDTCDAYKHENWDECDNCHVSKAIAKNPDGFMLGPNDHGLMMKLAKGGPVHAKYRRMIVVYVDITAPLYWWKEFDTYRVGVTPNPTDIEMNSCSTMHKIHAKEFTLEDFSREHLIDDYSVDVYIGGTDHNNTGSVEIMDLTIEVLNSYRQRFIETKDKKFWWQMIQLLPSSYNQKRTIKFNYEVLTNIYEWRKDHKLDEWRDMCKWIESLPYSEIITGKEVEE